MLAWRLATQDREPAGRRAHTRLASSASSRETTPPVAGAQRGSGMRRLRRNRTAIGRGSSDFHGRSPGLLSAARAARPLRWVFSGSRHNVTRRLATKLLEWVRSR
jgi:hypothetical protein